MPVEKIIAAAEEDLACIHDLTALAMATLVRALIRLAVTHYRFIFAELFNCAQ